MTVQDRCKDGRILARSWALIWHFTAQSLLPFLNNSIPILDHAAQGDILNMSEWSENPGSNANAEAIILLADEYCRAAQTLLEDGRKGKPLSLAPSRLCAIHAIELYLNAFLLHCGDNPKQIRRRKHDLAERANLVL